jgi:bifunctional DNA-binding transcriptional regulator/antitoxin component of YhaV-PrlF toxin-antitoxin module
MPVSRKATDGSGARRTAGLTGRVSPTGRLNLPAELRRAVGLETGGPVRIEVVDGLIQIRTIDQVKDRVRALARESGLAARASVDDFLSWRAHERDSEAGGAKAPTR